MFFLQIFQWKVITLWSVSHAQSNQIVAYCYTFYIFKPCLKGDLGRAFGKRMTITIRYGFETKI